ncbi:MAG TPA: Rrf2 family transcriptional regulator [Novosphingobium sp.]|nr:Rrf2 family transcriptional regulator [Novosphingobium sp.]
MQLTRHTDYALRLLICLAGEAGERTIADVARSQDISQAHLMKIANQLARAGFIAATRGRGGGIRLARAAAEINIGAVVAEMEPTCAMVDCGSCRLVRGCSLPAALRRAKQAFMAELAAYSLADIMVADGTAQAGQALPAT